MSKYVKQLLQGDLDRKVDKDKVRDFLVISTLGMSATADNALRGSLKADNIHMVMVRNSLFRRILRDRGMPQAADLLAGQCVLVHGGDSVVDIARQLVEMGKKVNAIQITGAFVDGMVLDAKSAESLSKLPSRVELQGRIVAIALSPGAAIAGALASPGAAIAGCIETLADRLEKQSN